MNKAIIFQLHLYSHYKKPTTSFFRAYKLGSVNTHLWDNIFTLGFSHKGITYWNTLTHIRQGSISNSAVIISAINQIILLPEGRGRIAGPVLLQGIGVGLPDPDLLVLECNAIWLKPTSKEHILHKSRHSEMIQTLILSGCTCAVKGWKEIFFPLPSDFPWFVARNHTSAFEAETNPYQKWRALGSREVSVFSKAIAAGRWSSVF